MKQASYYNSTLASLHVTFSEPNFLTCIYIYTYNNP